jgi:hypothetical protein
VAGSGAATEEVADGAAPPVDLRSEGAGSALGAPDEGFDRGGRGPAFTVTLCVGRLIEVRIFHLSALETISRLSHRIVTEAGARPSVILGDYRRTRPFSQSVGDAWSRAMRGFNDNVAWSAILLARSNDTFNLQVERVVRCAGNPGRRLFYDERELRDWVAQRATAAELSRVDQIVCEGPGARSV